MPLYIAKWFVKEEDSSQAMVFQEGHTSGKEEVAVPDLLFYEVANVLRYKKNVAVAVTEDALEILYDMELAVFSHTMIIKEAFHFARFYDTSIYDAAYAVLADLFGWRFITADKRLYQKLKTLPKVVLFQ